MPDFKFARDSQLHSIQAGVWALQHDDPNKEEFHITRQQGVLGIRVEAGKEIIETKIEVTRNNFSVPAAAQNSALSTLGVKQPVEAMEQIGSTKRLELEELSENKMFGKTIKGGVCDKDEMLTKESPGGSIGSPVNT